MCKKCERECIGMYLLHPVEMHKVELLKKRHPDSDFVLIVSPSNGEMFIRFKELHVIPNKN